MIGAVRPRGAIRSLKRGDVLERLRLQDGSAKDQDAPLITQSDSEGKTDMTGHLRRLGIILTILLRAFVLITPSR